MNAKELTTEQVDALKAYRKENGTKWKRRLVQTWDAETRRRKALRTVGEYSNYYRTVPAMDATPYGAILWGLRNNPTFNIYTYKASGRAKTVFNTGEIAHLWFHCAHSSGRNPQGTFSWRGADLISYSTVIARRVQHGKRVCVLMADRSWSNTTNGHQSECRSAGKGLDIPYFHVSVEMMLAINASKTPRQYARELASGYDKPNDMAATYLRSRVQEMLAQWKKWEAKIEKLRGDMARSRTRKTYIAGEINRTIENANAFSKFFGLRWTMTGAIHRNTMAKMKRAITARQAELDNLAPERKAKRIAKLHAALASWDADHADDLGKWQRNELSQLSRPPRLSWRQQQELYLVNIRLPRPIDLGGFDYARISGNDLETTRGARVPLEHAQRALPLILRVMASGKEWHTNGHTIHLGHYSVTSISADGVLVIGCHRFARAEVARIAKMLESVPTVPEETPAEQ
jgi:hypothetical protein